MEEARAQGWEGVSDSGFYNVPPGGLSCAAGLRTTDLELQFLGAEGSHVLMGLCLCAPASRPRNETLLLLSHIHTTLKLLSS